MIKTTSEFGIIKNDISLSNSKTALTPPTIDGKSFGDLLKEKAQESIESVNTNQKISEKAMLDMSTGNIKDLHQAAIAIGKAETSMKVLLEVRNKAISAYKEILRTQI